MQIRTKLTLQFILIVASILLFSLLAIYYFSEKHRENEFYNRLKNKALTTADLLIKVQEVDSSLLKLIDRSKKDVLHYENISVYDSLNKEIYTNNDSIDFAKIIVDIKNMINQVRLHGETRSSVEKMEIIGIQYTNKSNRFVVLAGAIDSYGLGNLQNLKKILLAVFLTVLLSVGFAGWIYAGRALKPISAIVNQVDNISETNLNLRLSEGNQKDEISRLSATFNKMLNRIEAAFKTQKTFVSNASHELRNPLTVITSQLEVSLLKERNPEEYKRIITSVLEDIKNLNTISHRLLQLTKISGEDTSIKFSDLRIDDLIWETKKEFLMQFPDYKANFFLNELPEDETQLHINGNASLLKTCFLNLMENSCKFSHEKTVTIKLIPKPEQTIIQFIDNGIGIPEDELPFIFEPFYRSKNTGNIKGYGIGLSLVEKIIRLHNARINVSSELNTGTTLSLHFPLP